MATSCGFESRRPHQAPKWRFRWRARNPRLGLPLCGIAHRVLPKFKRELQRKELEAASEAHIDALVTVYHSDHRELCAHERERPFQIVNLLELIGQSMGLKRHDRYKEPKILQDADQIIAECGDL